MDVVGVAADYDALLGVVDERTPDVVVTDIRMPPTGTDEGIRAADRSRATRSPRSASSSSASTPARRTRWRCSDGGSEGRAYLLKERVSDVGQLVAAIREVAGGGSVIDPKVVEAPGRRSEPHARLALERLTPREREVLARDGAGQEQRAPSPPRWSSPNAPSRSTSTRSSRSSA